MTKLEALNQILNIIVESEKEGRTILEAINLTAQAYGGKGDSTNNAVAIKELYDIFTETKTQLTPANIKKGKTVLGVEGDYHVADFSKYGTNYPASHYYTPWLLNLNLKHTKQAPKGSMEYAFSRLPLLKSLEFGDFDTSQVTNMREAFYGLSNVKKLDLSGFNTSNVSGMYDMYQMFSHCQSLTSLDLSSFNTSNVTDMSSMFNMCQSLTSLTLGPNWASKGYLTSFDLSYCPLTKESALDVLNKLADRTATTNKPTLTLKSTVKALLSDEEIKIATDKGWTVA